jgi:WD40 repeat protein
VWLSPGGSMLAQQWNDSTILWDLESGKQAQILPHPVVAISVAWSPDGTLLASDGGQYPAVGDQQDRSGYCVQTYGAHPGCRTGLRS